MISARRTVFIVKNDDKRILRYSHLPQKRRLLEVVEERKIKRTKMNKDLLIQMNEYSINIYLQQMLFEASHLFCKKIHFHKTFVTHWCG